MKRNRIVASLLGGAVAVGLLGSAAVTFAQAGTPTASPAVLAHRGGMGERMGPMGDQGQALADALGVTLDELQTAQTAAREAMIDQAVVDGYLTQAQADALKANTFGLGRGMRFGGLYDENQYLADALGISTDELQTAELAAHAAGLAAAVEAGYLTQEQADLMQAQMAARAYLDQDALQSQMTAAYEAAVAAAVADGAITQAQADALLAQMAAQPWGFGGRGFGFGGGHGGHGGPRGFGDLDGIVPAPSTTPNTSTGQGA
jgi:hypothetical protein